MKHFFLPSLFLASAIFAIASDASGQAAQDYYREQAIARVARDPHLPSELDAEGLPRGLESYRELFNGLLSASKGVLTKDTIDNQNIDVSVDCGDGQKGMTMGEYVVTVYFSAGVRMSVSYMYLGERLCYQIRFPNVSEPFFAMTQPHLGPIYNLPASGTIQEILSHDNIDSLVPFLDKELGSGYGSIVWHALNMCVYGWKLSSPLVTHAVFAQSGEICRMVKVTTDNVAIEVMLVAGKLTVCIPHCQSNSCADLQSPFYW